MTEQISSAGVYAYENDQSFYTQGNSTTGLAVVGPTEKGAAFVPTDITSYSEFTAVFGADTKASYTAQTAYNYLQAGSTVKVTRVLGNGGWSYSSTNKLAAIIKPSTVTSTGSFANTTVDTGSIVPWQSGPTYYFKLVGSADVYFSGYSGAPDGEGLGGVQYFNATGSLANTIGNLVLAINRTTANTKVTASYTGGANITLTATQVGAQGNDYNFSRVQPDGEDIGIDFPFANGTGVTFATAPQILTVLYPTQNDTVNTGLNGATVTGTHNQFKLTLSGSTFTQPAVSSSLNPTSDIYLTKVLGTDATYKTGSVFPYLLFGNAVTNSGVITGSANITGSLIFTTTACTFTSSNASGYDHAKTPWVLSDSGERLFTFHHVSDGFKTNKDVKVAIANINKGDTDVDYSTFDVIVRAYNDTDKYPSIIEQYIGVTLDPNSANFIGSMIGDKYSAYDELQEKVIENGDYMNISKYIRVEMTNGVSNGMTHPQLIPNGYEAIYEPIAGFNGYNLPAAAVVLSNSSSFVYSGFDYSNADNMNYLNPTPVEAGVGANVNFTKPSNESKFILPFQGGTDGMNYTTIKKIGAAIEADGSNVFGFDLSDSSAPGYGAYAKALNILSNNEEYVFDLLALPGVLEQYHGAVTAYAQSIVEERTDAVYIRDLTGLNANVATAVSTVAGLDSSYCATYYPWVKVNDLGSSKDILVPPSVVVPEVYAYSDRVSAEWFAPAGLSRGIIGAIDTRTRLSKKDRDALYKARINPIAKFPNTGVVVWGQKTLQVKDTALNRINVRRLLINLRGFISDISKNFVFDNNTTQTRNNLISEIVPYMESVQSRQGLYAFRVQIDETLNTNDAIDRNQLVGKIYVSPAKSIEFILLEFNVTATGGITM